MSCADSGWIGEHKNRSQFILDQQPPNDLNTQHLEMNYSYLLLFCGLSQLLLLVAANPPNPCTNPDNYNLVVPLRTTTTTNAYMNFPVDTPLTLYNGCYSLQISPYAFDVSQNTQTDTTPYANVNFYGYFTDSCNGISAYLSGYQYYSYQTLLTLSNNLNHASLAGLSFSGYAYFNSQTVEGFSVTTTPVTFEGHSPAQSKSNSRSVSRTGSQCRIVYQFNGISNKDASTNSFTLSLFLDGYGQIDFLVPSNVTAIFGTSNGSNTYHQCTCSGL